MGSRGGRSEVVALEGGSEGGGSEVVAGEGLAGEGHLKL